jgi:hypothetical protein
MDPNEGNITSFGGGIDIAVVEECYCAQNK